MCVVCVLVLCGCVGVEFLRSSARLFVWLCWEPGVGGLGLLMDPVTRGLLDDLKELLREGHITFQQYMEGGRQLREATASSSTAVPLGESSPSSLRVS